MNSVFSQELQKMEINCREYDCTVMAITPTWIRCSASARLESARVRAPRQPRDLA